MTIEQLEQRVAEMEARITRAEDIEAIQKLTYAYFNGLTLGKTEHLIDFFADDCQIATPKGLIEGRESVNRYLNELCGWHTGAESNFLLHPIIDVHGSHATGNWFFYFINTYYLTSQPMFVTAFLYDNEYVKINGQWKLKKIQWTLRYGPPARPPFPGCHGRKTVREEDLRSC